MQTRPLRLLILGGTGFIGPHQVSYALARGHRVTVFNRGRQRGRWQGQVEELFGDRNGDLSALRGRDWDVCIDNPTILPAWVRDAAAVLQGHIGHYIFISTISAYAACDRPDDEDALLETYQGADPMPETAASLAGDWRLYVEVLSRKGSQVAYVAAPLNKHRRHGSSVTAALNGAVHTAEIARVHAAMARLLGSDPALRARQRRYRRGLALPSLALPSLAHPGREPAAAVRRLPEPP